MNETQLAIKFDVGAYCRSYRQQCGYTLKQFADKYGANPKTVSGFENGRSTNMLYLFTYIKLISDNDNEVNFIRGIVDIIGGDELNKVMGSAKL